MGVGRCAVVRLGATHHLRNAVLLAQDLLEMAEEALGADLTVGDETDGLALERAEARRALTRLGGLAGGGIENTEGHGFTLLLRRLAVDAGADRQGYRAAAVAEPRRD